MFNDLHDRKIDYEISPKQHIIFQDKLNINETFPFLTKDSIKIVLDIIDKHKYLIQNSKRISYYIRGLGYYSSFIRNICYHETILQHLKKITGIELIPHYLFSNVGHVNIGIPNDKDVDHWHFDSVPYA